MSDTPIWMEHSGYGDVRPKHVTPQKVDIRNDFVPGKIPTEQLPVIATTYRGTDGIALASNDERLLCALCTFFQTEDRDIWKHGNNELPESCALICRPMIGNKTLLHCGREDVNRKGAPVYYYWKTKGEGENKKVVMNILASKKFCHFQYAEKWLDYCCDISIEWDSCGGKYGSWRESAFDTNRPWDRGFCFRYGNWEVAEARGASVIGHPLNWYTNELIASGTETQGETYYYALANQEYIIEGWEPYDNGGCYLIAIARVKNYCPEGWGKPYLYLGNDTFEHHKQFLNAHDAREDGDVVKALIDDAITEQKLPGFYKDAEGRVVFVQTEPYAKELSFRDITGCSSYGYRDYDDSIEVDHDNMIMPKKVTGGKIDVNPRAFYGDTPMTGGEQLGSWKGVRFFIIIKKTEGKEGQQETYKRTVSFTTQQKPTGIEFKDVDNLSTEPTYKSEQTADGWVTYIEIDCYACDNAGITRIEFLVRGIEGSLSLGGNWTTYEEFPALGTPTAYNPPVRV